MSKSKPPSLKKVILADTRGVVLYVLPGCITPERKTRGAVGYDAGIRAIVSPYEMDPVTTYLRKSIFDFKNLPTDKKIADRVKMARENGGKELVYQLLPGEHVTVGLGFIVAMPFPMFYWVAPRGGIAPKWGIAVINAPSIIDSDYRGEAVAVVENKSDDIFPLRRNMRIVQCIFQTAVIPEFTRVKKYGALPKSIRSTSAFCSTGLR